MGYLGQLFSTLTIQKFLNTYSKWTRKFLDRISRQGFHLLIHILCIPTASFTVHCYNFLVYNLHELNFYRASVYVYLFLDYFQDVKLKPLIWLYRPHNHPVVSVVPRIHSKCVSGCQTSNSHYTQH